MTITIRQLVIDYLGDDAPHELTLAMCELIGTARRISDERGVCAACLMLAAAELIDKALDAGKIGHESDEEEEVKVPTHPQVPIVQ